MLLAREGATVPRPRFFLDAETGIGPAYVMDRIEGETIPRRILRDEAYAEARPRMADQCGAILARIHATPVDALPDLPAPPEGRSASVHQVEQQRDLLDALGEPHPAFEIAMRWLLARAPATRTETLVHGDFRHGNLVVGADGVRSVLDWELAHRGDPLEDLGWLCVRSWRFGADLPVGGFGTREDLFAAYERAGGEPIDPEIVRWWEVFGTLKWGAICVLQASFHLRGLHRSVELAAIGRRVCETEYDLLRMIDWSF